MRRLFKFVYLVVGVGGPGLLPLVGCDAPPAPGAGLATAQSSAPAEAAALPAPAISVDDVMRGVVAPASQGIWDAAREEKAPQSDADWGALEQRAVQLAASGTLMLLGGSGPRDAEWAAEPGWREYARQLTQVAVRAREAAQGRSLERVLAAGDQLIESCEGCHQAYKPPLDAQE